MPGEYIFDISRMAGRGSAGAVTLLLQAILLPLALADGPSTLTIRGGTHVPWSPPAHYVQHVLLPTLALAGLDATLETTIWGWYPQGGGEVIVRIAGRAKLRGIDLRQRGRLTAIEGLCAASNLAGDIPQRIASLCNNRLRDAGLPATVGHQSRSGRSTGVGLGIAAVYEKSRAGFSALGEKGKPSPTVADEAIDALLTFHEQPNALDMHLTDQVLPTLALAEGESRLTSEELTLHTLTNLAVIRQFIDRKFEVTAREGESGTITIWA
jgi:RNA 3'-terminal phosphate cyclase (ATP)